MNSGKGKTLAQKNLCKIGILALVTACSTNTSNDPQTIEGDNAEKVLPAAELDRRLCALDENVDLLPLKQIELDIRSQKSHLRDWQSYYSEPLQIFPGREKYWVIQTRMNRTSSYLPGGSLLLIIPVSDIGIEEKLEQADLNSYLEKYARVCQVHQARKCIAFHNVGRRIRLYGETNLPVQDTHFKEWAEVQIFNTDGQIRLALDIYNDSGHLGKLIGKLMIPDTLEVICSKQTLKGE